MRYSRYCAPVVASLLLSLLLTTRSSFRVNATQTPHFETLKIYQDDGTISIFRGFPGRAVKLLFPSGEAVAVANPIPGEWKISSTSITKKIHTFRISDRKETFQIVGATFGDQLFIFDGVFGDSNAASMTQLIRATGSDPKSEADALDLTKVYLAMAYYELEDPNRFIAYRNDHPVSHQGGGNTRRFSDMVGIANSPKVTRVSSSFVVDLFGSDPLRAAPNRVTHWQIIIKPEYFEELVSARNENFKELHSAATDVPGKSQGKAQFHLYGMANGASADGAETDMQIWVSSNGPGAERIHYYYHSHEKAENRMHETLTNAVATLETRPWLDGEGNRVGIQAVLIRTGTDKRLFASEIADDDSSVLEVTSASLNNLMTVLNREIPSPEQ